MWGYYSVDCDGSVLCWNAYYSLSGDDLMIPGIRDGEEFSVNRLDVFGRVGCVRWMCGTVDNIPGLTESIIWVGFDVVYGDKIGMFSMIFGSN